jgi:hypothetical protein
MVARRRQQEMGALDQIRQRTIEKRALLTPGARSFILTAGDMTGQEIADTIVRHIKRIQRIAKNVKVPFTASITRNGVKVLQCGASDG